MTNQEIELAISRLRSGWDKPAFTPEIIDTWRRDLVSYTTEEFGRGLHVAKRRTGDKANWRPSPYTFASFLPDGPRIVPSNDWSAPHPDGPAPENDREMNLRKLAELREQFPNIPSKRKPSERGS